ncbi:MAG: hypothetical protein ACI9B8_001471 [Sulfitobacter sp.]
MFESCLYHLSAKENNGYYQERINIFTDAEKAVLRAYLAFWREIISVGVDEKEIARELEVRV